MLSALAPLRRRIALALAPELRPVAAPCDGPMPVFRSVRTAPQPNARPESGLTSPAERIAIFRRSIGQSQRGMAATLGVSQGFLGNIEAARCGPSRAFLQKLHARYGVSSDWVLTGTGPSPFAPRPRSAPPHPKC